MYVNSKKRSNNVYWLYFVEIVVFEMSQSLVADENKSPFIVNNLHIKWSPIARDY